LIPDWIIGILFNLLSFLVNLLPATPPRPDWFANVYEVFKKANTLIPISEFGIALAALGGVMAILYLWRAIRLFFPGG
jgi:hypothetical protein